MEDFIKNENKYMYRMLQLIIMGPQDNLSNAKKFVKTYSLASIKSNLKNARYIFPWNENHYDFIKSEIIVKNLNFNEGKCNFHLEPLPKNMVPFLRHIPIFIKIYAAS